MIVKSKSRQDGSFGQLVRYINKPAKKGYQEILHNLVLDSDTNDLCTIERKFIQNQQYALSRKNGVVLYHDVLSFSKHDKQQITEEILLDLGQKYLELRVPNALAYGRVHFDKGNPHIHFVISGNEVGSQKKAWIYKSELKKIKRELEAYQKERYPELVHSIAQGGKAKRKRTPTKETGQDEKARVFTLVQEAMRGANNETDIAERLERVGLTIYRRGKTVGVLDTNTKKKYRLKTLGLAEAYTQTIERAQLYAETTGAKSRNRVRVLGIAADILRVVKNFERVDTLGLEVKRKRKCGVEEVRREEAWQEVVRQKRARRWERGMGR